MAPLMRDDAMTAMESLGDAGGEPYADLLADRGVGHRVEGVSVSIR